MGKASRASRSVRVVIPRNRRTSGDEPEGRTRKVFASKVLRTNAIVEEALQADVDYHRNLAGLDKEAASALAAMQNHTADGEDPSPASDNLAGPMDVDPPNDNDDEWEDMEDGVEVEDEAMQEVLDFAKSYRQYEDKRTWRQRVQRLDEHWTKVMPALVEGYLRWQYPMLPPKHVPSNLPAWPSESPDIPTRVPSPPLPGLCQDPPHREDVEPALDTPPPTEPWSFSIAVYNVFDPREAVDITSHTGESPLATLALNGYLGASPIRPSIAVSFTTLELLRRIRLFKASYSIESFAKLVCYYYRFPYRRTVRNCISDAFDVYLAILRDVKKSTDHSLGRDSPNWRALNSCPACSYKLDDEQPPRFSRMYCMDGNNSLKRMRPLGNRNAGDVRVFEDSDYFLPKGFVDKFANEVRAKPLEQNSSPAGNQRTEDTRHDGNEPSAPDLGSSGLLPLNEPCSSSVPIDRAPQDPAPADDDGDGIQGVDGEAEGDPTDGTGQAQSSCTKNWKAAQSDDKKRSWDVFEETGVFASACRHGFILWIIDMVRSGELARYPLATVSKVLEVLGKQTLGGYDVGCSLQGTIRRSSLGKLFDEHKSRICVNAFHGYSHEYSCQVKHHPNSIEGIGLEDLETMERIFSASNALAPIIRYASAYRRRVLIDTFFQQWDDEKYLNLGKMLYENYRQALGIIKEQSLVVADAMVSLELTPDDLKRYAVEEREYLNTLGKESPHDLHEIVYVEVLQELREISTQLARTNRRFLAEAPATLTFMPPHSGPTNYEAETSKTRKIETDRRYLDERRKVLMLERADLEIRLGIPATWQPSDKDYMRVARYIATRKYQKALSNLQRLVVQRLFELHKMNLAKTGYRMRRHIAKNMQTRSRALRNAIQTYNAAAAALDPPRATLDWDSISHYQLLQEFDLLNETRADIRAKPWAQPAIRETIRLAQRLDRAREELTAVHREARRLHTAIRDENLLFTTVLAQLERAHNPLFGAVNEFATRRRAASAHVMVALRKLYALPEFSGNPKPGIRAGTSASPNTSSLESGEFEAALLSETVAVDAEERFGQGMDVEEEEEQDELTELGNFVGGLSM